MTKQRTILQILPALDTGGVERGTIDIAHALIQAGHRAIVVSNGGQLVHHLDTMGAVHITLPVHSKNPFTIAKNKRALIDIIKQYDVDLVHARSRAPAWSAYGACKACNIPYITTFHGTYNFSNRLKKYYNSIMVRGETTIVASDFIRRHVMEHYGLDKKHITLIPRGVDMDVFNPKLVRAERLSQMLDKWQVPHGRPIVLLPGRLTRWKGQELLLDAMALLADKYTNDTMPVCVLLGSDQGRTEYTQSLRDKAEHLGLNVCIPGGTNDMAAAYKTADVVVSASTDPEAFGRVSAESQAMGKPTIAPNHGAAPEIVLTGDNGTGWLFESGNAQSLADCLHQALTLSISKRTKLASTATKHITQNLTNPHMCQRTLAVYDKILKSWH